MVLSREPKEKPMKKSSSATLDSPLPSTPHEIMGRPSSTGGYHLPYLSCLMFPPVRWVDYL